MLAVGARPAARDDVREQRSSYLDTAHGSVASPLLRRTGVPDGHVRSVFVVPVGVVDHAAVRTAFSVDSLALPARRFVQFVATGSSRGPPRG